MKDCAGRLFAQRHFVGIQTGCYFATQSTFDIHGITTGEGGQKGYMKTDRHGDGGRSKTKHLRRKTPPRKRLNLNSVPAQSHLIPPNPSREKYKKSPSLKLLPGVDFYDVRAAKGAASGRICAEDPRHIVSLCNPLAASMLPDSGVYLFDRVMPFS